MGNIETATKFSRLKSIYRIEDNYLEAAQKAFYKKKCFKNFAMITGK